MLNKILKISIVIVVLSNLIYAEDKIPAGWWQKGSYQYEETNATLAHIEGMISYSKTSGNDDNEDLKIKVAGKIRSGHVGASLSYTKIDQKHKSYNDKNDKTPAATSKDDYTTTLILGYDINKDFFLNLGYENSRNLTFEIYNQTTKYLGVGYRLLSTDMHRLNVFLAVGTEDISFGTYPQLPSGETDCMYYQANYTWFMQPRVLFSTNYTYLQAKKDNRDTATLTAKVKVKVTKNISLIVGYSNEFMEAQDTVNRYTHDETVFTAVKFDF